MEKTDVAQPISTTLNGSNYIPWVQGIRSFLKGRKLWQYVTGDIKPPKKAAGEADEKFSERLQDWNSKNHQIITWFRNTSIPSIHLQFGRYDTAKEVWDLLATRYTTSDLSSQYQLWEELHNLKQERGESITSFYAKMEAKWDQLALSEPIFNCTADTEKYVEHRDKMRLILLLMALNDDFAPCRASLLHQSPLPTLDSALSRLLYDETRLGLLKPQQDVNVLAAVNRNSLAKRGQKFCRQCNMYGHVLYECSLVECHKCKQKGHVATNCTTQPFQRSDRWKNQPRPEQSSKPVVAAAAANDDPSATPSIEGTSSGADTSNSLKILSYNVWFREDLEVHRRMKAIGDLIQLHSPDLICFQEVTPHIYNIFGQSTWWKVYLCSVSNDMLDSRPYFCMQLSKLPVKSFSGKPFRNSIMGRKLCITEVEVFGGKSLVIATSHLESPCPSPPTWNQMFSKERVEQAIEAIDILKSNPNVVFGGDMNWDDKLDGQFPLPDGWIDAWAELRPGEIGWTYDTKSNQMLSGNRPLQKRLDRFVCNLHDFKVTGIDMIGKEVIPGVSFIKEKKVRQEVKKLELPVLPSDHYGLLLTISTQ